MEHLWFVRWISFYILNVQHHIDNSIDNNEYDPLNECSFWLIFSFSHHDEPQQTASTKVKQFENQLSKKRKEGNEIPIGQQP